MNKTRIAFILLCCCMIEGAFAQVIEINGGVKEARTKAPWSLPTWYCKR